MEMSGAPKGRKVTIYASQLTALRARVAELERTLHESKLDLGQVTAERDNLRYYNKLLRDRRDELDAANSEWQKKYRGERRLREEQRDLVEAAEHRAASLQADLDSAIQVHEAERQNFALDVERLTQALAESERKRAELLDKHRALHAVVRYHGT